MQQIHIKVLLHPVCGLQPINCLAFGKRRGLHTTKLEQENTQNDGHFHLEGVEVRQLCPGAVPGRVYSKGVGCLRGGCQPLIEYSWAERGVQSHGCSVGDVRLPWAGPVAGAKNTGGH